MLQRLFQMLFGPALPLQIIQSVRHFVEMTGLLSMFIKLMALKLLVWLFLDSQQETIISHPSIHFRGYSQGQETAWF